MGKRDYEASYLSSLIKKRCGFDIGIEVKVTTFNINIGHNEVLLESCPVLNLYCLLQKRKSN